MQRFLFLHAFINLKLRKKGVINLEKKLLYKKSAAVLVFMLLTLLTIAPSFSATIEKEMNQVKIDDDTEQVIQKVNNQGSHPAIRYDTNYYPIESVNLAGLQNDIGYNVDAGNTIGRADFVYIGEPIEETIPGRGRTGTLDPSNRDDDDYYRFSACKGQQISYSLTSSEPYFIEVVDNQRNLVENGAILEETTWYFVHIYCEDDAGNGEYFFTVQLTGQNDANSGGDAGNTMNAATSIQPGTKYDGYMDQSDTEDWYAFDVNSGQGIEITVNIMEKSDYDLHLYNPNGEKVHSAQYYGDDTLAYPADSSGTWFVQLDIFPGWDETKWPDDYLLYGSGVYELELTLGGTVDPIVEPLPQPDINPIAQLFTIQDDPLSSKDEYGYLAAVPASNYISEGERFVSPIIYQGVDDIPTWFTSVDQTTGYLVDDWNTYLSRHEMSASVFEIPSNPVTAAASIATQKWNSADTVVVAVDGSDFEDQIENVINTETSLSSSPTIERVSPSDFQDVGGSNAKPMLLGSKWGAIHLVSQGDDFAGDTGLITPRYEGMMEDWWPYPYDANGQDKDTFYPVTKPGLWFPYVTETDGLDELQVIKYEGDRYQIPITDTDTSIEVTINTEEESSLIVYLIDPDGNVRRPQIPHYNGGEIKPIHQWNGGHWEHDQDEFRQLIIEPHTEYSVDVHNAMQGTWTAIVVPYLDENGEDIGFSGSYSIKIDKRVYNEKRLNAAMSAANGAVIASMNHAPLLYVTENDIPAETSEALSSLNPENIIFVNIGSISSAEVDATKELLLMQEVIDEIKSNEHSENFITITSLGTKEGYFAPAAMAAAYHTSPVLNIGEASDAYNTIDKIASWREYAGDYYHGCRSVGHLPQMDHPIELSNPPNWIRLFIYYLTHDQEFPPLGLDLKLEWFGTVATDMQRLISDYNLDRAGKEAFLFVSPRDTDIRDVACRAMVGNESFAGHIPVETAAFSSAIICRNILYPALIYANPGRDVITSQMMNYPDGYTWLANDGNGYPNYATQEIKASFSSRDRFFEGHCIVENLIDRYNKGASLSYYSGHGTGGSGISGQYKNVAEQFPFAELRHDHLKDFDWWDSWRGYSGFDNLQTETCRSGGESSYNSQEPSLYDIVHFKWCDQLFENLHSELEFWSSCTTGEHWGPIVYLSHGSALWYGNVGSAYGVQDDLHNAWVFHDVLVEGKSVGESQSEYTWLFNRDFTTLDPTTLYGRSSMFQLDQGGLTNVKVLYGDPTLTCYAPDWIEPTPIES